MPKRQRRPRRKAPRKAKLMKSLTGNQYATIQETIEYSEVQPNSAYQCVFNLSQFVRAAALAPNFRWMRPIKAIWKLEPLYNTFQQETTSQLSIPYYYSVMNRTQDSRPQVTTDFQACGAQPRKLTSPITFSYRPNWCSMGLPVQDPQTKNIQFLGLKAQYDWCQTPITNVSGLPMTGVVTPQNSLTVPYGPAVATTPGNYAGGQSFNGHDILLDQEYFAAAPAAVARLTLTVVWQFKEPASSILPREKPTVATISV